MDAISIDSEIRQRLAYYEKDYARLRAENWQLRTVLAADMLGADEARATRVIDRRWLLTEMCCVKLRIDHDDDRVITFTAVEDEADGTPLGDQFPFVTGKDLGKGL